MSVTPIHSSSFIPTFAPRDESLESTALISGPSSSPVDEIDTFSGGREPTGGEQTITQLKDALNQIPSFLESRAMGILDNEELMTLIIKNPRILDHAAEGDVRSIEAVKGAMADGVNRFVFSLASYTGLLELGSRSLEDLATVLETNPDFGSALLVLLDAGVPMGSVLKDIRDNEVDEKILVRFADGKPRVGDLVYFYGYLKEKAGGDILIDVHLDAFRSLLNRLNLDSRLNIDAISQVHITRDNQLIIDLKPEEALVKVAGIEIRPGKSIVLDVDITAMGEKSLLGLHAQTEAGKGFRAFFADWSIHPTGNVALDILSDLLLKIVLSPLLLILATAGEFAHPELLMRDEAGVMQVEPIVYGTVPPKVSNQSAS